MHDEHKMFSLLTRNKIELVVHFSGNAYVGESMDSPEAYYQNITVSGPACAHGLTTSHTTPLLPPVLGR